MPPSHSWNMRHLLIRFWRFLAECQRDMLGRLRPGSLLIGTMTFAPLYDNVFISTAVNGQLADTASDGIFHSIVLGAACFSGGGAVAGALSLTGSLAHRMLSVVGVYLAIAIGILAESGVSMWPPWRLPGFVLLAFAVGFLVTLAAAVLASFLSHWLNPQWITNAGVGSVATIALSDMVVSVPSGLPIGILIGGAVIPPVLRTRRARRCRCWRRARRIKRQTPRLSGRGDPGNTSDNELRTDN